MIRTPRLSRRSLLKSSLVPVAAGSLALAGSTRPSPVAARRAQGDPIVLPYWQAYTEYASVAEIIARFNEANPGIRVETTVYNDYFELAQAVQTAAAAGEPPALAGIGYTFIRYVVANVPHLTTQDATVFDGSGNEYLADGFPANILGLGQLDGVQHGMPFIIGTPYLFYNADLFAQAGLDRGPATWDEVREFSLVIKERTGALGLYIQEPADFWAHQALIESNGAQLLIAADGQPPRTGVDSPEAIEALRFHAEMVLVDETAAHLEFRQGEQSFNSAQIAMEVASGDSLRTPVQSGAFNVGAVPFPTFGDKPRKVPAGGNNLFIFAADEEVQRAAWEYIKFASSPESLTLVTEETGYIPPRQALIDDPEYLKPFYDANPLYRAELEQSADTVTWVSWPGPNGLEAEQVLLDMRDRILSGNQDASEAATAAAEQVNELIQE